VSDKPQRHEITMKRVLCDLPGSDATVVRRDVRYDSNDTGESTLDIYYPAGADREAPLPAIVFVAAFRDVGVPLTLGCRFKEMEMVVSWARLIAAAGVAAVAYTTREPAADVRRAIAFVQRDARALGIRSDRIGIWAASGSGPVALSALMGDADADIRCAVLLYPYLLDLGGSHAVAEAAKQYGFANACAGRSMDDLQRDVPLLIVRAGRDHFAGLNSALDEFVAGALARNMPLTVVNDPTAPHAFDLFRDGEETRDRIRQILDFVRVHLAGSSSA